MQVFSVLKPQIVESHKIISVSWVLPSLDEQTDIDIVDMYFGKKRKPVLDNNTVVVLNQRLEIVNSNPKIVFKIIDVQTGHHIKQPVIGKLLGDTNQYKMIY